MTRIFEPDNAEIVRLALVRTLRNGAAAAADDAEGADDGADYRISVGLDSALSQYVDNQKNPFPLVDVHLSSVRAAAGSATVNRRNRSAVFDILCMAEGNSGGGKNPWRSANTRAWKVARVVRRILEAEENTYLGLRGVVSAHSVEEMQAGQVDEESSSVWVCAVKVSVRVDFVEGVDVVTGEALEGAMTEINSD